MTDSSQEAAFELRRSEFAQAIGLTHQDLKRKGVDNVIKQRTIRPANSSFYEWKEQTASIHESVLDIVIKSPVPISVNNTYIELTVHVGTMVLANGPNNNNINTVIAPLNAGLSRSWNGPHRSEDRQELTFNSSSTRKFPNPEDWLTSLGFSGNLADSFEKYVKKDNTLDGPKDLGSSIYKSLCQGYLTLESSSFFTEFMGFDAMGMINNIALYLRNDSVATWVIPTPSEQDVLFSTCIMLRQIFGSDWDFYLTGIVAAIEHFIPTMWKHKKQQFYWTQRQHWSAERYPMQESSTIKVKFPILQFFAAENVMTTAWANNSYIRVVVNLNSAEKCITRCLTREPKFVDQNQYR